MSSHQQRSQQHEDGSAHNRRTRFTAPSSSAQPIYGNIYGASFPPQNPSLQAQQAGHQMRRPLPTSKALNALYSKPPQRTTKVSSKLVVFPPSEQLVGQTATTTPSTNTTLQLQPPHQQPTQTQSIIPPASPISTSSSAGVIPDQDPFSDAYLVETGTPAGPATVSNAPAIPRTEAERIPKEMRTGLPRVTCYCAAESYDLSSVMAFLKERHRVKPMLYDECLYIAYEHGGQQQQQHHHHYPKSMHGGIGGARKMSSFSNRKRGGGEASYHSDSLRHRSGLAGTTGSLAGDRMPHGGGGGGPGSHVTSPIGTPHLSSNHFIAQPAQQGSTQDLHNGLYPTSVNARINSNNSPSPYMPPTGSNYADFGGTHPISGTSPVQSHGSGGAEESGRSSVVGGGQNVTPLQGLSGLSIAMKDGDMSVGVRRSNVSIFEEGRASMAAAGVREAPSWMGRNEVFVFEYGVIVLWNFSEEEEISYLSTLKPFATNPRIISDIEIEDFHFQYDIVGPNQPRIFNDMITLKSGNPLIKLTISHGVAQSATLNYFENMMDEEVEMASVLPKMMAQYGEVKLKREDVIKVVGRLFRLRVNVNLISNVLDTPELFWSEPELEPLYNAIRGYLEISQRVKLLNTRASVISDTLDMLTEHLNGSEMAYITVVIIALIVVSCCVMMAEIGVKILSLRAGMDG